MTELATTKSAFRVFALPQFMRKNRWRTEAMRSYSHPILIWFTKGQGRITISGVTRGYGPHNAVFLPAGTLHGFDMLGQVYGAVVHFPRKSDAQLPSEPLHLRFREAPQQAELSAIIDNIQREVASNLDNKAHALELHAGLLAVWLARQADLMPDAILKLDRPRRLLAAFSSLVSRDFKSGKLVSAYAADLGITSTHLSRICNSAFGKPASAVLAERTHFEARKMLGETKVSIKDIARQLGFTSPAYFTRAFHKHAGMTPSSFRKIS